MYNTKIWQKCWSFFAEDETAKHAHMAYTTNKDALIDFCGHVASEGKQHICVGNSQSTVNSHIHGELWLSDLRQRIWSMLHTFRSITTENNIEAVLVEQAEDETVIIKLLQYLQATEMVVGSCGPAGPDHESQPNHLWIIGNYDDNAYDKLRNSFILVSLMAMVIMLDPLQPAMVINMVPTCNKFNYQHVEEHWEISPLVSFDNYDIAFLMDFFFLNRGE